MFEKFEKDLDFTVNRFLNLKFHKPEIYEHYIAQTYYYIEHSVKLLALAIENTHNEEFQKRSREHIKEENNHELMALRDLKALGKDLQHYPENQATKQLYMTQYNLIRNHGGEVLLGYIYFLESLAIKLAPFHDNLKSEYNGKASVFIKVHVEEDQKHIIEARENIEGSKMKREIFDNITTTFETYNAFLDEVYKSACEKSQMVLAA